MSYVFKYTEANGYRKVFISKSDHNRIFKYRQIKWHHKYEYFLNDNNDHFVMIRLTSFLGKILDTSIYPITVLIHGITRIKEVNREIYEIWNEKKTGTFSCDDANKNYKNWNELISAIKNKEH